MSGDAAVGASVPVLMYHSVAVAGSRRIRRFVVSPEAFAAQLDRIEALGYTTVTVSELVDSRQIGTVLPDKPVVVTFDDGYADFAEEVAPALRRRGMTATLYVTTGALQGVGPQPGVATDLPLPRWSERTLSWAQLAPLEAAGIEIGAHSHTHPAMDAIDDDRLVVETQGSRRLLQACLEQPVRSFAYPFGYAGPKAMAAVRAAGFDSACGVRHALSGPLDHSHLIARLEITRHTTPEELAAWLRGEGVRVSPCPDRVRTRAWRTARRLRRDAHGALPQRLRRGVVRS